MRRSSRHVIGLGGLVAVVSLSGGCGEDGGSGVGAPTVVSIAGSSTTGPTATSSPSTEDASVALVACGDVPTFVPGVVGTDGGTGGGIDPIFHGVLLTYAEEHHDTFGGMWIDREAHGTFVLGFTDDPDAHRAALSARAPAVTDVQAVVPPPTIVDTRPIGEWGVPFDVVQVPHTEAELRTAVRTVMGSLQDAGVAVDGAGVDVERSRVSIHPRGPMTPSHLAAMTEAVIPAVPIDLVCVDGVVVEDVPEPVRPGTPLDVIRLPDASGAHPSDTEVECSGVRFRLGDVSAPTPLDVVDPGLRAVLDGWLAGPEGQHWPQDGWFLLEEDAERATFANVGVDGASFVHAESGRNGWIWSGGSSGDCDVRLALPDGLGSATWVVDPAFPAPDATATELHLLVEERACAGGTPPGERLLGPQIVETDSAVRIAFAVIPLTGDQTCPSNPATPVTVSLERPLAQRELRDGLAIAAIADLVPG